MVGIGIKNLRACLAVAALVLGVAASAQAEMATGTYTGNGNDDRAVTGIGFQPDFVFIKGDQWEDGVCRTSTMSGDAAKSMVDYDSVQQNLIQSLDADGFTLGSDTSINNSGTVYQWTAFRAEPGVMAVGSYLGIGTNGFVDWVGFQPDYLTIIAEADAMPWQRISSMPVGFSMPFGSQGAYGNLITDFRPDGFDIGSDWEVNQSGWAYHFVAFRGIPGSMQVGSYVGDGTDDRAIGDPGFRPEFVLMKTSAIEFAVHRPSSLGNGDETQHFGYIANGANEIQSLDATGFEVGTHSRVNESGSNYYWAAFANPSPQAELELSLVGDLATANAGNRVDFTATLVNNGADTGTGIEVTIPLPPGLTLTASSPSQGTYDSGTGVWRVGDLADTAGAELHLVAVVAPGSEGLDLTLVASVTALTEVDPLPDNDSATASLRINAAAPHALVASGTFLGDGSDDRAIDSVGFQPDLVIIKGDLNEEAYARSATMAPDAARSMFSDPGVGPDILQFFTSDGFVVGSSTAANMAGVVYQWTAFRAAPGEMHLGVYDGDKADDRDITGLGFRPDYVLLLCENDRRPWQRSSAMAGDLAVPFRNEDAREDRIQALLADGFQVGTNNHVNDTDHTYHYVAWQAVPGRMTVGNYTGDGSDGRGIAGLGLAPEYFIVKSEDNENGAHRSRAIGTGDATMAFDDTGNFPNGIQVLEEDRIELGDDNQVNRNGSLFFWAAFAAPEEIDLEVVKTAGTPTANERSFVTFEVTVRNLGSGLATGIVLDDPLPAGLSHIFDSATHGDYDEGTGQWNLGSLEGGQGATLALTVQVDAGTGGQTLVNSAAVSALDQVDIDGTNDGDSASVTINAVSVQMMVETGTYNGDDGAARAITGVGFRPDVVIIKGDNLQTAVCRTSTMPAGQTKSLGEGTPLVAGRILSFEGDGFTVGADPGVNAAGIAYEWVAFMAAPGELVVGSYVGDGLDDRPVTGLGLDPAYMFVISELSLRPWQRFSAMAADASLPFAGATPRANLIQDFMADGFVVGTSAEVNQAAELFHYVAWAEMGQRATTGTYTGSGAARTISGTSIEPEYVLVKQDGAADGAHRTGSLDVDPASLLFGPGAYLADAITGFDVDGFDLGTRPEVNTSGEDYHWIGFSDEEPLNADLEVTMLLDRPIANPGDRVVFNVVVVNNGPVDATGVVISDLLPGGLAFAGANPLGGTYDDGTGDWTVGDLAAGSGAGLQLSATVVSLTAGAVLTNTATVTDADQFDPVPGNNTASTSVRVLGADLVVTKTVNRPNADQGDTLVYTVTVTNAGPDITNAVAVCDSLPPDLKFVDAVTAHGSYSLATSTWSVGKLAVGETATLVIRDVVSGGDDGATIVNTAFVCGTSVYDPVAANDTASVPVDVRARVDLQLALATADTLVNLGDTVTFDLSLSNPATSTASGVLVTDLLPAGLGFQSATPQQGTYDSGSGVWDVGSLAAGAVTTLRLVARVTAGTAGQEYLNSAAVSGLDQLDPVPGNDTAAVVVRIASADLAVFKTVDEFLPHEDESIVYTVIVANLGPDPATGVVVTDILPDGLVLEGFDPGAGAYDAGTGLWTVGDLAVGTTDTLLLTTSFESILVSRDILNVASVSAADQADPSSSNDTAGMPVTVVEPSIISAVPVQFAQQTRRLLPGSPSDEILAVTLHNGGERWEVLTEVSLTNIAPPDSNQSRLDSDWESLELLVTNDADRGFGDAKVATLAPQVFADGRLTFTGMEVGIAAGDSVVLSVRGAVSLQARDGDVLRVAVAGPGDLVFRNRIELDGIWPLFSEGSLVVDGMTSDQIHLHPVEPQVFQVGSGRNQALAFTVPANGYQSDILTKINVANYGDATPGDVITRMEAWVDDGDTVIDAASDRLLGELYPTGGRWERTDLAEPVDLTGLIIIVTVDINELALSGSVRLGLPGPDDFGIGMDSGNDGPVDRNLVNPFTQTVSASDRVILTTGLIEGGDVVPGGTVPVLHLIANNIYTVPQTLQRLVVRNASVGANGATGALMDGLASQLLLRRDDGDGVLEDLTTDPVLGTAVFDGGAAVFDGLSWQLPADGTRHLFLTAEVSLTGAADGDSLAAVVSSGGGLDFTQPVAQVASWPLDSQARWMVDGMVAAQVGNAPVPLVTLAPGDGPVLALDVIIPANGALADTLRELEIVNNGTATTGNFDTMELWAEAGTAGFGGGDTLLGTMTPIAGLWRIQGLDVPIPVGGLQLYLSVNVSLTPVNGATLRLALPQNGVGVASQNDGPHDAAVVSPVTLMLSDAPLISVLEWERPDSVEEQFVDLRMIVRNNGGETINVISPSPPVFGGTGAFHPPGLHTPPSLNLAPGQVDTFTWQCQADALGDVQVTGNCTGNGAVSGNTRSSVTAQSPDHHIFLPALEMGLYPVGNMPFSINRGQQGVVPLTLTLLNPGGVDAADAELRRLTIALDDGDDNPVVPADLLEQVVVNEGLDIYLAKTALETVGNTILLDLDESVTVTGAEPVTLALRLDILSNTLEESFRVSIVDSTWLEAYDAVSGQRVPIVLQEGSFPVQSSPGSLVGEAIGLDVIQVAATTVTAGQGQTDVPLLALELLSEGTDPQSSDVEIGAFGVSLVDTLGVALSEPQRFLERIRVLGPLQAHAEHAVVSAADSVLIFTLSPPVTVPVGSQSLTLTLAGDLPEDADLGALRVRLRPTADFDARDGNTGSQVQVDYLPDPIVSAPVIVQGRAAELRLAGQGALPSILPLGASGVTALTTTVRHPGVTGTAAVDASHLRVNLRDGARQPVRPADYIDRLHVWQGATLLGEGIPSSQDMGELDIPLSGFTLVAGQAMDLTLTVDFEADAPVGLLELLLTTDVLDAVDANQGTPVQVQGEAPDDLPLSSGLTLLQTPPELVTVGFTDRMPAMLAADDSEFTVALLRLSNPADPDYAAAGIATVTLHARGDDGEFLAMGDAVLEVLAYDGPDTWAAASLAEGDSAAALTGSEALLLEPGQAAVLEVRLRLRPGTRVENLQVGLDADDIIVVAEGGGVLPVQVLPEPGSAFPFWTETGSLTGLNLAQSYSNFPNPFAAGREQTTFVFALPTDGRVSLRVLTPRGETVLQILNNVSLPAGLHQDVMWDGRNGRGTAVTNGVYIAEIRVTYADGTNERYLRKVAVVR